MLAVALPATAADMPQPKAPVITQPQVPAVTPPTVTPPTVAIPAPAIIGKAGKLTPAQQLRVNARVPVVKKQIADLSADEQRAVLRKSAPPRPKLTDAERDAKREANAKAMRDSWAAKTQQDRADLRQKQLAAWQKLAPADRAYRIERMQEQLKALPEADRKAIIAPFVPSAVPAAEAKAP